MRTYSLYYIILSMNKSYLYEISGGCGSTKFELNIINDKFNGKYKSHWMGSDDFECKLEGRVVKNTNKMYNLYTDEITDIKTLKKYECKEFDDICKKTISTVTFRLFDIDGTNKFDVLDHEFDGMVMGGCGVNKDATYNAVMIVCYGERFGAYNYGANKRKDDFVDILCKLMHYIPLRDMSIPIKSRDNPEYSDDSED